MKKAIVYSLILSLILFPVAVYSATAKKSWTALAWINAAGSGSFDTLAGTTEEFTSAVDMATNGYVGAHVVVDLNFDATPTDDMIINLYSSLDGSTWDDIPVSQVRIDNANDPGQISIKIDGLAQWRIGVVQTGSTDTHDFRVSYRAWTVDIQ